MAKTLKEDGGKGSPLNKSGVDDDTATDYGNEDVIKEAKRTKKSGGSVAVGKATGGAAMPRADKRARGGAIHKAQGGGAWPWSSAHKK